MNPNTAQILASERIRESRRQAAAARLVNAARGPRRRVSTGQARRPHWLPRSV